MPCRFFLVLLAPQTMSLRQATPGCDPHLRQRALYRGFHTTAVIPSIHLVAMTMSRTVVVIPGAANAVSAANQAVVAVSEGGSACTCVCVCVHAFLTTCKRGTVCCSPSFEWKKKSKKPVEKLPSRSIFPYPALTVCH